MSNKLAVIAINTMLYYFLRVCTGHPYEYAEELELFLLEAERVLRSEEESDEEMAGLVKAMIKEEMDAGSYAEDPDLLDVMEDEFGHLQAIRLFELVRISYLE